MKRLALAVALACVLTGVTRAGEIHTTGAVAPPTTAPGEISTTGEPVAITGEIHSTGGETAVIAVILTLLSSVR
jgi:hypothetical protein